MFFPPSTPGSPGRPDHALPGLVRPPLQRSLRRASAAHPRSDSCSAGIPKPRCLASAPAPNTDRVATAGVSSPSQMEPDAGARDLLPVKEGSVRREESLVAPAAQDASKTFHKIRAFPKNDKSHFTPVVKALVALFQKPLLFRAIRIANFWHGVCPSVTRSDGCRSRRLPDRSAVGHRVSAAAGLETA